MPFVHLPAQGAGGKNIIQSGHENGSLDGWISGSVDLELGKYILISDLDLWICGSVVLLHFLKPATILANEGIVPHYDPYSAQDIYKALYDIF